MPILLFPIYFHYLEMPKQEMMSSESEQVSHSSEHAVQLKKEEDLRHDRPRPPRLDYIAPKDETEVKKQLKDESQTRSYLTPAKIEEQNKLMCGRNLTRTKARVETVMFAPPAREIPLIAKKLGAKAVVNPKLEFEVIARKLIEGMKRAHKLDLKAAEAGTLVYHKVKMIEQLKDKLTNIYVRRSFVQQGALPLLQKWLERSPSDQQEPSLHVRISTGLNLTADDLQNTKQLSHLLQRNRMSQVQQLRELCREVLSSWDFTMVEHAARRK